MRWNISRSMDGWRLVYKSAKCTVIVDYAHNAVSMESLLLTLRDYKPKRLVCVFGCGGNRRARSPVLDGERLGGKLAESVDHHGG